MTRAMSLTAFCVSFVPDAWEIFPDRRASTSAAAISAMPAGLTLDGSAGAEKTLPNHSTTQSLPFSGQNKTRNKPKGRVCSAVPPYSPGKTGPLHALRGEPRAATPFTARLGSDLHIPPVRAAFQPGTALSLDAQTLLLFVIGTYYRDYSTVFSRRQSMPAWISSHFFLEARV